MYTPDDILQGLSVFAPQKIGRYVEVHMPLILDMNKQCLTLRIIPAETGFFISDGAYTFEDFCESTEYYFRLFSKKYEKMCAGFSVENDAIVKKYEKNTSLICAIDEYIRLLITLDKFVSENGLR